MPRIYSVIEISDFLEQQQETVHTVDKYTQPIISNFHEHQNLNNNPNYCADFVMHHIFTNIRNIYQDSIFISQGLIKAKPYYISTSLYFAQRESQDFLIDLAYIIRDRKNKQGDEYLHYLTFILHREIGLETIAQESKDFYDRFLSNITHQKPNNRNFWSTIDNKNKIKEGLEFYKIELPILTDYRGSIRRNLSSAAHGNRVSFFTLTRTHEENVSSLEIELTASVSFFHLVMRSAIECYFRLYLNKQKEYKEIISVMFPQIEV